MLFKGCCEYVRYLEDEVPVLSPMQHTSWVMRHMWITTLDGRQSLQISSIYRSAFCSGVVRPRTAQYPPD